MKKCRYFLLFALLTASQAAAQTTPSTHTLPDSRTVEVTDGFDDQFFLGGLDDKILASAVHEGTL